MISLPLAATLSARVASVVVLAATIVPFSLHAQAPKPPQEIKWDKMDLGPFHTATFKIKDQVTAKGIAIKVGGSAAPATMLFDPELMRMSAGWSGGFIKFPRGRGGLEGQTTPDGELAFSTAYSPGWAKAGEVADDPRERHQGSLPPSMAKWRGIYLNGENTILHYEVAGTPVLELPGAEQKAERQFFTRTFQVGSLREGRSILIADLPGGSASTEGPTAILSEQGKVDPAQTRTLMVGGVGLPQGAKFRSSANGRILLDLPASASESKFRIVLWSGMKAAAPAASDLTAPAQLPDLAALRKGGAPRWGAPLETKGTLGTGDDAYVADEITLPEDNPFGSWFRPGGHDFLPDGTAVLASVSGDVWLVSGLDEKLENIKWKRFATGLFQPLGLKVVKGQIYVTGRDQITRLQDVNGDGEADYYENFNNDCVVTENYHEFALDLDTDSEGNFYYAKGSPWEPTVVSPHQGCLMKITPDGSKMSIFATGLRAPNGLAIGPGNVISVSDNEGHWMPSNRLNIVKEGGFYGMVTAAHKVLTFKGADGEEFKANPSDPKDQAALKQKFWGKADSPIPAEGMEPPLCWLPKQQVDNSPGGEVWVPKGDKWGPMGGQMLHMSYGKCALYNVLPQKVGDTVQGGVVRFPIKFSSGIMRGRFSPKDGQLYLSGLRVWQSDAAKDGCFTRVRYTGKATAMPLAMSATPGGVEIKFTSPLDEQSTMDAENYSVEQWNYRWTGAYGSAEYSLFDPQKKGRDLVVLEKVQLSPDKKTLTLTLSDRAPAMQMRIKYKIKSASGQVIDQEIYNTINKIPGSPTASR